MPALDEGNPGVNAVRIFGRLLEELLDEAAIAKESTEIEPPLNKQDFNDLAGRVASAANKVNQQNDTRPSDQLKGRQFAIIETAARDLFSQFIATTDIESPKFVAVWNLLDILSILSDDGQCDPALLFWLVEELLDSQTIAGCRQIFDFLESRRERITANHFKQKQLIILRMCNELLRSLSRAEDTAFCGRVFIFMFQSFPLGDKSSVNLRGEYHIENVTTYEQTPANGDSKMDVDSPADGGKEKGEPKAASKNVAFDAQKGDKPLEPDALYPLFWSLQESFSQPKKLFDAGHLAAFKENLSATMAVFESIRNDNVSRKSAEDAKRGLKRKREDSQVDDKSNAFNPKYLTSRDLFELEICDLSFRRHVLVQVLIILDFLLSLSTKAREKLQTANATNRSVMYMDQVVSEEDAKWAMSIKGKVENYLRQGSDGPYFHRMVETVLARDKNWVRWKIEGCQAIKRDPVTPADFVDAMGTAQRNATNKRLRPVPMGSVSLDFLHEDDDDAEMERLKDPQRYQLPDLVLFKNKIADDDFEISMPTNSETKAAAVAGKASKSWRALRIAARSKLVAFDKLDDPNNISVVFEELKEADEDEAVGEAASEEDMPSNRDPIVVSGPTGVGKTTLVDRLMEAHRGVFAKVVRHTTREPAGGEVNGKTFHFVKAQEFNQLRDGDRLVEYGTRDGVDYGTSTKAIDAITENGKIPIIELDLEAAQFAKDMDFQARYILVKPPSPDALSERLEASGRDATAIQAIIKDLPAALKESKSGDLFDRTLVNEDLDASTKALGGIMYEQGGTDMANGDSKMEDA